MNRNQQKRKKRFTRSVDDSPSSDDEDSDYEICKPKKKFMKSQHGWQNRKYTLMKPDDERFERTIAILFMCNRCGGKYSFIGMTPYMYDNKKFICKKCTEKSITEKVYIDTDDYLCNDCDFRGINLERLRDHMRHHLFEPSYIVKCNECVFASSKECNFQEHYRMNHLNDDCKQNILSIKFEEKEKFKPCKISPEAETKEETEEYIYKCEICPSKCVALA